MQTSALSAQVMELDMPSRCLFLHPKLMYSDENDMEMQPQSIPPNPVLQTSQSIFPEISTSVHSESFSIPPNGTQQEGISASPFTSSTGTSKSSMKIATAPLQSVTEITPPFAENIWTNPLHVAEHHICLDDHPFCNGSCTSPQVDALTTHANLVRTLLNYEPSADPSTVLSAANLAMKFLEKEKRMGKLRQSTESPALSIESDSMSDMQQRIVFLFRQLIF
jgi:hypothetical protein